MRAIAFADLDDTLFQSLRKCPDDIPVETLVPLGFRENGSPHSYATPRQMRMVRWLTENACFVPVTARGRDALSRVRLRWDHAVCAHGGVIIDAGATDPVWQEQIAAAAAAHEPMLRQFYQWLQKDGGDEISARVVEEDGIALFVLAKSRRGDAKALAKVAAAVAADVPHDWISHCNGNNAAFIPPFLGKRNAVAYLLPKLRAAYPDAPSIGIGDSDTDAGFMALCDFAMMPGGSQLARHSFLGLA